MSLFYLVLIYQFVVKVMISEEKMSESSGSGSEGNQLKQKLPSSSHSDNFNRIQTGNRDTAEETTNKAASSGISFKD